MKRVFILAACALAAGCTCTPTYIDCQVRCGAKSLCPDGTQCNSGFCRPAGFTGVCTCRPGEEQPCGGGQGECHPGKQTCQPDRTWAGCTGEGVASPETCDGKDNDCNGATDDKVTDSQSCEKKLGVCAGKFHACVNGEYLPTCGASDYGPDYEASETKCDGLDNDCDGRPDFLAPVRLADDGGRWALLGLDGGFALATLTRSADGGFLLEGRLYDDRLAQVAGPVQLAEGGGTVTSLQAVARGDRALLTWATQPSAGPAVADAIEWSRANPSAPVHFAGLPLADDRGTGQVWLGQPQLGAVGAYTLVDGGAAVLNWAQVTSAPIVTPFTVPATTLTRVDLVAPSHFGFSARWVSSNSAGVVLLNGTRASPSLPQGPLLEGRTQLQSAWRESVVQVSPALNYSGVAVQYDVWDGGSFLVRQFNDYRTVGSLGAAQTPGGLFVAWSEFGVLNVGSPLNNSANMRSARPGEDGGLGLVANVQVANAGTQWNAVGYEQNGIRALLVCAP